MTERSTPETEAERFLPSGSEAGTAPGDRKFRPDVEGLRAIAVLLVVLFHAGVYHLVGGYVGVDVFFVISGFVITGVLLRETMATGRPRLLDFYGRRALRIIPMAMVVIAAVLIVERLGSGQPAVESLADGARWAALFGANYHTILMFAPYWSLAVEEQFYLVYPALLLVVVFVMRDWPLRRKLCGFLLAVIAASYSWSILAPAGAGYQSSLARAWELAVGALVAVATDQLKRIPAPVAAAITWVGGVLLLVVAFTLRLSPTYPGAVAALPVAAAALIIAGGTAAPPRGTEAVLKLAPFRWLGRWSYSLYLWHWPLLVLAAQHWRRTDLATNLGLVALAVVLSACCYFWIENPIRHSALLTRSPLTELAFGAAIVGLCLGLVAVAS